MSLGESETVSPQATLVVDTGSSVFKAGFAGDRSPRVVFPTIVGRWKRKDLAKTLPGSLDMKDAYVGNEAASRRGVLAVKYPMESGIITNWEDMTVLWKHTFENELRVNPKDHPILMTEAPLNPKGNREKMTQIFFEEFEVPALYVANTAVLKLYESQRTTGVVFNCSTALTLAVPIYEGHVLPHAVTHTFIAGRDITDYLAKLLVKRGYFHQMTRKEHDTVRDIKEKLCFVASDFEQEMQEAASNPSAYEQTYELPSGEVVTLGKERFMCPEALFKPSMLDEGSRGIHEVTNNAISRCEAVLREELYANIVLGGGSTLYPGIADRMRKEMITLAPHGSEVNVVSSTTQYPAWVGGAILASHSSFPQVWMTREEYEEYGPRLVYLKCF